MPSLSLTKSWSCKRVIQASASIVVSQSFGFTPTVNNCCLFWHRSCIFDYARVAIVSNVCCLKSGKLVPFFLGKRIWWFPLAFSRCGVQGKLKFLLGFGFIVSLLFYFVRTRWNSAAGFFHRSQVTGHRSQVTLKTVSKTRDVTISRDSQEVYRCFHATNPNLKCFTV